jgi:hypothetical protein
MRQIIKNFINRWDRIIRNISIIDETDSLEILLIDETNYQKLY